MWEATSFPVVQAHVDSLFDEISTRTNVYFSAEAKDVLSKEIILRGNYHRKGLDEIGRIFPEEEAFQLCDKLREGKSKGKVGAKVVESILVKSKTERIVPMIAGLIDEKIEMAEISVDAGVKQLLNRDLSARTTKMAESGLLVDEIVQMNDLYIDAIMCAAAPKFARFGGRVNKSEYSKIGMSIFNPIVCLTITSEPAGAAVNVAATFIGNTIIEKKPFEAQKTYKFTFSSSDYKTSERSYYVEPFPLEQKLNEVLLR